MKNILIKSSGDVSDNKKFYDFAVYQAKRNYTVVICGGGSKINNALEKEGYKIKFDKHGRIMKTWEERKIAREILEQEEKRLQDKFVGTGVNVIPPLLNAYSVLCPINADNLVKSFYLGFDEIYVFTTKERIKNKEKIFKDYPKVKIIGLKKSLEYRL